MSEEKYLTPKEVAELLNVARTTVYTWIDQKRIPCKRIGGKILILQSDIDKYLIKE